MPAPPQPSEIPVFGVPRYRASVPYLAVAPRATFRNPDTWSFLAGLVAGRPVWVTHRQWESRRNAAGEWMPPPDAEIYDAQPAGERCVGEHSVTWNAPLRTWLLLYSCVPWTLEARFAPNPWGPWSPPIIMLSAVQDPNVVCTLIQSANGCTGLQNYWTLPTGTPWPGAFYAPFVMPKRPDDVELIRLHDEAAKQLAIAADYIEKCGYHRRDEELAELQAALKGESTFADLPPRA
jgi:hypothetical protein